MEPLIVLGAYAYTWNAWPFASANTSGSAASQRARASGSRNSGIAGAWSFTGLKKTGAPRLSTNTHRVPKQFTSTPTIALPPSCLCSFTCARSGTYTYRRNPRSVP